MPRLMSALARKDIEQMEDRQPQRLQGKYAELAELAEEVEEVEEPSRGELFWEFIFDDLLEEDEA